MKCEEKNSDILDLFMLIFSCYEFLFLGQETEVKRVANAFIKRIEKTKSVTKAKHIKRSV